MLAFGIAGLLSQYSPLIIECSDEKRSTKATHCSTSQIEQWGQDLVNDLLMCRNFSKSSFEYLCIK